MVISYKNYLMAIGFGVAVATSAQAASVAPYYYAENFSDSVLNNIYTANTIKLRLENFIASVSQFPKNARQVEAFINALNDGYMQSFFELVGVELMQNEGSSLTSVTVDEETFYDDARETMRSVRKFLYDYYNECLTRAAGNADLLSRVATWKQMIDEKIQALKNFVMDNRGEAVVREVASPEVTSDSFDVSLKRMFSGFYPITKSGAKISEESLQKAFDEAIEIYNKEEAGSRPPKDEISSFVGDIYNNGIIKKQPTEGSLDFRMMSRLKLTFLEKIKAPEASRGWWQRAQCAVLTAAVGLVSAVAVAAAVAANSMS